MPLPLIDIHAHILPSLDDGPGDIHETHALLEEMCKANIEKAFCTSHYQSPHFDVTLEDMHVKYQLVCEERTVQKHSTPELALGAEVRLAQSLTQDFQNHTIPTLGNTRYVLVEFDTTSLPDISMNWIHELRVRKYIPIMAHPERNLALQRDPKLIDDLRELGILMQATAVCLTSDESKTKHKSNKLAWMWLREGKIDLIASDAHNTTTRPPGLQAAYECISAKVGDAVVETLMTNAYAVWKDETCVPVEVTRQEKRRWWS